MATGQVKGEWQNSIPRRSETPQPIDTKFETGDYVRETTPCAKFRANPSIGGLLGKWVKYNENFSPIYIPFFVDRPTGHTARRIFTRNGSNNVASRKGQTFLGTEIRS